MSTGVRSGSGAQPRSSCPTWYDELALGARATLPPMSSPPTTEERHALSNIALVAGLVAAATGAVAFTWAYNRIYADNGRNLGYGVGVVGLMGGASLLFTSALLWPRRRHRTDT